MGDDVLLRMGIDFNASQTEAQVKASFDRIKAMAADAFMQSGTYGQGFGGWLNTPSGQPFDKALGEASMAVAGLRTQFESLYASWRNGAPLIADIANQIKSMHAGPLGPQQANPGWGAGWDGSPGLGVFGPNTLGMNSGAGGLAIAQGMAERAGVSLDSIKLQATGAGDAIRGLGPASDLAARGLQYFLLYRGFHVLETEVRNSITAMVDLDHEVSLIMVRLPNFGAGLRDAITQSVIGIAKQTGDSFTEIAQGMEKIAAAGATGDQLDNLTLTMAKLARVTGTDVSSAFEVARGAAESFGMGLDQIGSIADKMVQLATTGQLTLTQVESVGPRLYEAFANMGANIDTANAAMAALSQTMTGPAFTRGATGLQQFALAIADTPQKFNAIGISVANTDGSFRDMIPILEDLKAKLAGMTQGDAATALHSIAPNRQELTAVEALLNNLDQMKKSYVEQQLSLGTLDKAFQTTNFDIKTQGQELATAVQTGFKPMADTLGLVFLGFNNLEKAMPGVTSLIVEMTGAVVALYLAQNMLARSSVDSVAAFAKTGTLFKGGLAAIAGIATVAGDISSGTGQGFTSGGILQAGLGGAGTGAMIGSAIPGVGTLVGAISGLVISETVYGLSAMTHSDAPKQAATDFATTFKNALVANANAPTVAFAKALATESPGGGGGDIGNLSMQLLGYQQASRTAFRNEGPKSDPTRYQVPFQENYAVPQDAFKSAYGKLLEDIKSYDMSTTEGTVALEATSEVLGAKLPAGTSTLMSKFAEAGLSADQASQALKLLAFGDYKGYFNLLASVKTATAAVPDIAKEFKVPGMSTLDTELDNVAKGIRFGFKDSRTGLPRLLDTFDLTADQLQKMSDEVATFNSVVAGVGVFESLKKLGDDIGISDAQKKNLQAAEITFASQLTAGGASMADLFANPDKLAKLVGEMKFGDVKVDNSTNNNMSYVIRFEGNVPDVTKAAEFADAVMAAINTSAGRAVK